MKQYSCFLIRPTSEVADLVVLDACDDRQISEAVADILRANGSYTLAEIYDDDMRMFELRHPRQAFDAAHLSLRGETPRQSWKDVPAKSARLA